MTTRSLLLVLATAVVSPVIVGLVLLKIEYSIFTIVTPENQELQQQAIEVINSIESIQETDKSEFIEDDITELKFLFAAAQNIYGSTPRNQELEKVIAESLSENKPGFAYVVAKEVYGSSPRNIQYSKIIDKCIELGRMTLAMSIAEDVYGSSARNTEYRKIIDTGILERNKDPDD